jgi:hypothetical protein
LLPLTIRSILLICPRGASSLVQLAYQGLLLESFILKKSDYYLHHMETKGGLKLVLVNKDLNKLEQKYQNNSHKK